MEKELANSYKIEITKMKEPRLIIVGLDKEYTNEEINSQLISLNYYLNEEDKVYIKYARKSKKSVKWTMYVETNGKTFEKLVNREVNIGWKSCKVYEDLNIMMCYKCCGYGHKTTNCTREQKCYLCAGNHCGRDCKEEKQKKWINLLETLIKTVIL